MAVIEFYKALRVCSVPNCDRKYYAKGYCKKHYDQYCRDGGYCFTWDEFIRHRIAQRLKEVVGKEVIKKPEASIKHRVTKEFYQKLTKIDTKEFTYKDIVSITGWKYQRIKKHILRLVKLGKIETLECHSGGGSKQGKFRLPVMGF